MDVVKLHVAAMCNRRRERQAMQMSYDDCIALRTPPCPLDVEPSFRDHLMFVTHAHARQRGLMVYYETRGLLISIRFDVHLLKLALSVHHKIQLRKKHYSHSMNAWNVREGSATQSYCMDVSDGSCEWNETTIREPFIVPALFEAARECRLRCITWVINK